MAARVAKQSTNISTASVCGGGAPCAAGRPTAAVTAHPVACSNAQRQPGLPTAEKLGTTKCSAGSGGNSTCATHSAPLRRHARAASTGNG